MEKSTKWVFFLLLFLTFLTGWAPLCPAQTPADLGAVSWWTFDGDVNDRISANHGQPVGAPSYDLGISGQALKLNGSPDCVLIPDSPDLRITGSISLSVWVKPAVSGQYAKVLSKRDGTRFWFIGLDHLVPYGGVGNGDWRVTPRPGGSGCDYAEDTPIASNIWHHLVFVYDANAANMTIYVNGWDAGPFAVPEGFTLPAMEGISVSIGADSQGAERFFTGLIDDLSLFNRALTGSEAAALFQGEGRPTCRWPVWVDDYQQGLRKDGSTVIDQRSDVDVTRGEVTGDTAEGTFFSLGYGGHVDLGYNHMMWGGSLTVLETSWGSSVPLEEASVYAWNGGSWVNLGRADNAAGVDSHPSTFHWSGFAANQFRIMDATDPDGQSADSDAFDLDGIQACGILENGQVPYAFFSADPQLIYEGESSTLVWETGEASLVEITPGIGAVQAVGSLQVSPGETTTYTLSAHGLGTATAEAQVKVVSRQPRAHWTFDGMSSDVSGNGNHATIWGLGILRRGPFYDGMLFDGMAEYGQVMDNEGLRLTDGFTLSAWVLPEGHSQYAKIISKRNGNQFWFLGLDEGVPYGGVGNGWYRVTPRPSGADCDYPDTRIITPGEWHHLVFTYDGTDKTMTLWVDGESRGRFETRDDFELPPLEGVDISIAADNQGTDHYFQGALDDMRIYPRVLAAEEIIGLYQEAALPQCGWVSSVVDYQQGPRKDGGAVVAERSDPAAMLGEITGNTQEGTFFTLGFGGWVILNFDEPVTDGNITVFETTWGEGFPPETAEVQGWDGAQWIRIGWAWNGEGEDFHASHLRWSGHTFQQFKLLDVTDPDLWGVGTRSDGFDVDGVVVCGGYVENTPPVANAGDDQTVNVGEVVHLDAGLSYDPDGHDLTYSWYFTTRPAGSQVELDDRYAVDPEFVPDLPGEYVLLLMVSDGWDSGPPDWVTITAQINSNHDPVFTSSPVTDAVANDLYQYQALATDEDQDPITFILESAPDGMTIDAYGFVTWLPADEGTYQVVILARDDQGGETRQSYTVTVAAGAALPGNPGDQAPAPNPGGVSTPEGQFSFLYDGDDPIQKEADSDTFSPLRLSVIRGRAINRDGAALPAVTIRVKNHPEYGYTLTRPDGWFDLAVNGGETLVVQYSKDGYFPAQRVVKPGWNDWGYVDEVALVIADSKVTAIDLDDTGHPFQVAQGRPVSDDAGDRQATILFPSGADAVMTLPGGGTQNLTTLNVRATEYTVGENGPRAMPAKLPPETGYTYCVELSADEALAAGAKRVDFSQTLYVYLDNFLEFPVGEVVPAGYYDPDLSSWVAAPNGLVVKILGIDDGKAVLTVAADEIEATPEQLSALNITDDEREQLAQLYPEGKSLWRMPITHFTSWDWNSPLGPPGDAVSPTKDNPEPRAGDIPPVCTTCPGCVVDVQNMSLGEEIDLVGVPFNLAYRSNRMPGRKDGKVIDIPLSGDDIPDSLKAIRLTVTVAGQVQEMTFTPSANLSHTFEWDGLDAYGREVEGETEMRIKVVYVYDGVYYSSGSGVSAPAWRQLGKQDSEGNFTVIGNKREGIFEYTRDWVVDIGNPFNLNAKHLGGWTLDVHHGYDPMGKILYTGDGRQTSVNGGDIVLETLFSWGTGSHKGIAVAPGGDVYFTRGYAVYKYTADGQISRVAGTGSAGYSGDGGPALDATLNTPRDIDFGPDGCLYIVDSTNHCIRKVDTNGIITTVAGTGVAGDSGDGGPAVEARMNAPFGLYIHSDGTLYVTEITGDRVRRISADGIIDTVVTLDSPAPIVGDREGNLYIGQVRFTHKVLKLDTSGNLTTVAGSISYGYNGDGIPADTAQLSYPSGLAIGPDEALYIGESWNHRIRRVGGDGIITTVAGAGSDPYYAAGNNAPAYRAYYYNTEDFEFTPNGAIYAACSSDMYSFRVKPSLPGFGVGEYYVPDESGSVYYVFDSEGRHLRTVDAVNGNHLLTFDYDDNNLLTGIIDLDGDLTIIERNPDGKPQAIVGPDGQRTTLTLDDHGYLKTVTDPMGQTWEFTYTAEGLLTKTQNPRQFSNQYVYDDLGRLSSDTDPAGGGWSLGRTEEADTYTITLTSGENRVSTYTVEKLVEGGMTQTDTGSDGSVSNVEEDPAGDMMRASGDGTTMGLVQGPDPRFGMMAPVVKEATITLPSGLLAQMAETREVVLSDENDLDSLTRLTETLTVNGKTSTSVYTASDRTWTVTSPEGRQALIETDEKGRTAGIQMTGLAETSFTYDGRGRLVTITQGTGPDARTSTVTYHQTGDQAGWVATVTDSVNRTVEFQYDAAGRTTHQTLPDSRVVQFGYDANDNTTAVTPPGKPVHTFVYNNVDLNEIYTPPDLDGITNPSTTYTYNLDKQFTGITLPGGRQGQALYNTAGQLVALTTPDGSYTYDYQITGGRYLDSITTPNNDTLSFTYDGPITTGVTWTGTVNGQYQLTLNNDLKITSDNVNGDYTIEYQYDNDGLVIQAGDLTLTRDPDNGLLTGTALSNITTSIIYNPFAEPEAYTAQYGAETPYSAAYTRDKAGRIETKTETTDAGAVTYTYIYGPAGRLYQVLEDDVLIEENTYDTNGNRTQIERPSETITATYDDQDRMLTFGDNSYTYTDNGELATKANTEGTTTYEYDLLGNLKQVTLPSGSAIEYIVDGAGRRIGKKVDGALVQAFIYQDALNPVAELDGNGNIVARFIYGDKGNVPSYIIKIDPDTGEEATYRIISDHLGSPRLAIDVNTGDIAQQIEYDTWGRVLQDSNPGFQPFGFGDGLYDSDTGLVRLGARVYDLETGRWTVKDPILFAGGDANLYGYCLSDPVNFIDIDGLSAMEVAVPIAIIVSQFDSPVPGPADLVAGAIIGVALLIDAWPDGIPTELAATNSNQDNNCQAYSDEKRLW